MSTKDENAGTGEKLAADVRRMIRPTPQNMRSAEYERAVYCLEVHPATTLDQMLDPQFWAHVADRLRPNDRLEVTLEDKTFMAEFRVMAVEKGSVRVAKLHVFKLAPDHGEQVVPGFTVAWGTQATKFRAFRDSDKQLLRDGFASQSDAYTWLLQNRRTLAS